MEVEKNMSPFGLGFREYEGGSWPLAEFTNDQKVHNIHSLVKPQPSIRIKIGKRYYSV